MLSFSRALKKKSPSQYEKELFLNYPFKLLSKSRIPFFASWPSVRPWFFSNPQPTFRCIADVEIIALKLSEAARSRISEINLSNSNAIKNVNIQDGEITA